MSWNPWSDEELDVQECRHRGLARYNAESYRAMFRPNPNVPTDYDFGIGTFIIDQDWLTVTIVEDTPNGQQRRRVLQTDAKRNFPYHYARYLYYEYRELVENDSYYAWVLDYKPWLPPNYPYGTANYYHGTFYLY